MCEHGIGEGSWGAQARKREFDEAFRVRDRKVAKEQGIDEVKDGDIGANVSIFTLINALLLRDLPVPHPERLVELSLVRQGHKITFSYPMFRELDRGQRVFSALIAWSGPWLSNVEVNGVLEIGRAHV